MNPFDFRTLFHIQVRDFEKSLRFYDEMLGLTFIGGWKGLYDRGARFAAGDSAVVEIVGAPEGERWDSRPPSGVGIMLQVENLDAWHERLTAAGLEIAPQQESPPWGRRAFVIEDPDGTPIHFYCLAERTNDD